MLKKHRKSSRRGASLVEYVSVMAIGAALLAGGAVFLGRSTKGTFELAGEAFSPSAARHKAVASAEALPTDADDAADQELVSGGVAIVLLMLGGVGLVFVHLAKKKQPAVKRIIEDEDAPPAAPEIPKHVAAQFVAKRQHILQVLDRELWSVFDGRIMVRDILTEQPATVRPDAPVERVRKVLEEEQIHQVLVVDAQGALLGIVHEHACDGAKGKTAADIMRRDPETAPPGMQVVNAISAMLDRKITCLPVMEEGRVIGVVTTSDMLMTLQCCIQLLQRLAGAMWQPGMSMPTAWEEASLAPTEESTGDATGRFFDVMKSLQESRQ